MKSNREAPAQARVEDKVAAYIAQVAKMTAMQWETVSMVLGWRDMKVWNVAVAKLAVWAWQIQESDAAYDDALEAAKASGAEWLIAYPVAYGAQAVLLRKRLSPEHFDTLTAHMRAAGIDFDNL